MPADRDSQSDLFRWAIRRLKPGQMLLRSDSGWSLIQRRFSGYWARRTAVTHEGERTSEVPVIETLEPAEFTSSNLRNFLAEYDAFGRYLRPLYAPDPVWVEDTDALGNKKTPMPPAIEDRHHSWMKQPETPTFDFRLRFVDDLTQQQMELRPSIEQIGVERRSSGRSSEFYLPLQRWVRGELKHAGFDVDRARYWAAGNAVTFDDFVPNIFVDRTDHNPFLGSAGILEAGARIALDRHFAFRGHIFPNDSTNTQPLKDRCWYGYGIKVNAIGQPYLREIHTTPHRELIDEVGELFGMINLRRQAIAFGVSRAGGQSEFAVHVAERSGQIVTELGGSRKLDVAVAESVRRLSTLDQSFSLEL